MATNKGNSGAYAVYLCTSDGPLVRQPCSAGGADHEPAPDGYMQWHEWAEEMGKTHRSVRCKVCGRFGLWVEKKRSGLRNSS